MKKIGKTGKGGVVTGVFIGIFLLVAVAVILWATGTFNAISGGGNGGGVTGVGCNIAPSVNVLATNTLVSGTTPSLSANYSIYDGSYVGSIPTSPSKGKSLDVMATATSYLNSESKIDSLQCDGNDLKFAFTPYASPTLTVYDSSYNTLSLTAKNETYSANSITDTLKIAGTPLKSTGDMLVVVDYSNKTEVLPSDITLKGGTVVGNPTWYTPGSTASSVKSFTVPAVVNGGSNSYDITFAPESGQTIGAVNSTVSIYVYTLHPMVLDTNKGIFQTTNTWQDSLGANKTIATVSATYAVHNP